MFSLIINNVLNNPNAVVGVFAFVGVPSAPVRGTQNGKINVVSCATNQGGDNNIELFESKWKSFIANAPKPERFQLKIIDKKTGLEKVKNTFNSSKYFNSEEFKEDLNVHYQK